MRPFSERHSLAVRCVWAEVCLIRANQVPRSFVLPGPLEALLNNLLREVARALAQFEGDAVDWTVVDAPDRDLKVRAALGGANAAAAGWDGDTRFEVSAAFARKSKKTLDP